MNESVVKLIKQHNKNGILIDTNILLLYFIGDYNPDIISRFKRTAAFTVEDYNLLVAFLKNFRKILTTPNILTEVNSFSQQMGEPNRTEYFHSFVKKLNLTEEHYVESKVAGDSESFIRYGLTDSVTVILSTRKHLLLTDDFKLAQYLSSKNYDVINFNHIRVLGWSQ